MRAFKMVYFGLWNIVIIFCENIPERKNKCKFSPKDINPDFHKWEIVKNKI